MNRGKNFSLLNSRPFQAASRSQSFHRLKTRYLLIKLTSNTGSFKFVSLHRSKTRRLLISSGPIQTASHALSCPQSRRKASPDETHVIFRWLQVSKLFDCADDCIYSFHSHLFLHVGLRLRTRRTDCQICRYIAALPQMC